MTRITRRWVTGASLAAGLVGGAGLVARASPQAHEHHPAAPSASGYAEMGPHMKATVKAAAKPGDLERAERLVQDTRRVIERYEDYRVVVQDGYKPSCRTCPSRNTTSRITGTAWRRASASTPSTRPRCST